MRRISSMTWARFWVSLTQPCSPMAILDCRGAPANAYGTDSRPLSRTFAITLTPWACSHAPSSWFAVGVSDLLCDRHVPVQREVGADHACEPTEFVRVSFGVTPQPLESVVVLVEVDPCPPVRRSHRHRIGERDQRSGHRLAGFDSGDVVRADQRQALQEPAVERVANVAP